MIESRLGNVANFVRLRTRQRRSSPASLSGNFVAVSAKLFPCCIRSPSRNLLGKMPPKKDAKASSAKQPQKTQKKKEGGGSGGKAKKKKWSKGKVRDKLNNLVHFDKQTYEKLLREVPSYKLITPSIVSERLKVKGSLARRALDELLQQGFIKLVVKHHAQVIYTRTTKVDDPAS
ncbi:UNVERIFIED_CONTAM: hypothetical protein PYX00_007668 [Menopon gallinae]|uniref:40S ribosomal protein S25 n=1 Tax=Menopon gallinae TaxID=328185 RepID=A0AAW2HL65_9NEOP